MSWLLLRYLIGLLAIAGGGFIGLVMGGERGSIVGALLAGLVGFATIVAFDSLRGRRLMRWLRGSHDDMAPRDAGFWGELAYRVERALRSLERAADFERDRLAQFVAAMEASPNGVMLLDAADQIEWCNARAADHFGLDPQRDRRQRVTNLVRAPAFVACLQDDQSAGSVNIPDTRGMGTISLLIRRYGDDMKLVLSQDITERERSEVMRRDFVANVSHEIRTPLTVLSGFIETMTNLPLSEVERRRVLVLMTQQARRMETLVRDLLILAQLEGSPRPTADCWITLDTVLAQAEAEALALSSGRHQVRFVHDTGVQIAGVEAELHSAFTNLVSNAVRYTPESGQIDVGWRLMSDGSGELTVSDTGPGVAREHLSRLTERFYRVDGSRSRDTGGTGLGLSIVKHVVQRHGGELDIQSELGKGSTFRLVVPAARVRPVADAVQTLSGSGSAEAGSD